MISLAKKPEVPFSQTVLPISSFRVIVTERLEFDMNRILGRADHTGDKIDFFVIGIQNEGLQHLTVEESCRCDT